MHVVPSDLLSEVMKSEHMWTPWRCMTDRGVNGNVCWLSRCILKPRVNRALYSLTIYLLIILASDWVSHSLHNNAPFSLTLQLWFWLIALFFIWILSTVNIFHFLCLYEYIICWSMYDLPNHIPVLCTHAIKEILRLLQFNLLTSPELMHVL